jgi:hypothetical protein
LRVYRPSDAHREDIAELFSLGALLRVLRSAGFVPELRMRAAVAQLFAEPRSMVWSNFHLRFVRVLQRTRMDRLLRRLTNDKIGIINTLAAPTWYLVCRKAGA